MEDELTKVNVGFDEARAMLTYALNGSNRHLKTKYATHRFYHKPQPDAILYDPN